ncbi:Uncharacterised protein [Bordetella pertussis]|nr:Uncharacterised protein [Bordetella pertussis]
MRSKVEMKETGSPVASAASCSDMSCFCRATRNCRPSCWVLAERLGRAGSCGAGAVLASARLMAEMFRPSTLRRRRMVLIRPRSCSP